VSQYKGFSDKWVSWIKNILLQAALKYFSMAHLVYNSNAEDVLGRGILLCNGKDYTIVQYADDTLIILPVDAIQLFTIKGLLRSFADSTSLKVNYVISPN
jgi:hypothetical protein